MNNSDFFKVRNFCQGRTLLSLARGIKKSSYGNGLHTTITNKIACLKEGTRDEL